MSRLFEYITKWFGRTPEEEYRAVRTEVLVTRPDGEPELINPIYKATENGPAGSAQELPKEETHPSMEEVPTNKVEEGIDDLGIQELSGDL